MLKHSGITSQLNLELYAINARVFFFFIESKMFYFVLKN